MKGLSERIFKDTRLGIRIVYTTFGVTFSDDQRRLLVLEAADKERELSLLIGSKV